MLEVPPVWLVCIEVVPSVSEITWVTVPVLSSFLSVEMRSSWIYKNCNISPNYSSSKISQIHNIFEQYGLFFSVRTKICMPYYPTVCKLQRVCLVRWDGHSEIHDSFMTYSSSKISQIHNIFEQYGLFFSVRTKICMPYYPTVCKLQRGCLVRWDGHSEIHDSVAVCIRIFPETKKNYRYRKLIL